MRKRLNLIGQKYGRWTVVSLHHRDSRYMAHYDCICDCGKTGIVQLGSLRSGGSRSCGCLKDENAGTYFITHGMTRTRTYKSWAEMKARCYNPRCIRYPRYGGRGIVVCERWLHSFENFLADMGERPKGMTIDRIDNNGNYEPNNCRWATYKQQANNSSNARPLTFNGETLCLSDWAKAKGFKAATIRGRLRKGWTVEQALETPRWKAA